MDKKPLIAAAFTAAITASAVFIEPEEGISLKAYQDVGKVWTICRGHTGPDVTRMTVYDKAMCETLFRSDIWKAMKGVLTYTKVELPQPILVSMTSFSFNAGIYNYRDSTMLKLLNKGDFAAACKQLPRWKFAGGLDCSIRSNNCWGVWDRRLREQELCMSGVPK
ncbi:Lysozyme RrrD [compost metagenome]